jgi:HSP20 family protein
MIPMIRTNLPFSPLGGTAFNRFDSLFERFFGEDGDGPRSPWRYNEMPVSLWQDENNTYVEAELPGVAEKDLEIAVHNDVLTIKAERHAEAGRTFLYNGRTFGRFERTIVLSEPADAEHVEATLTDGVLRIVLPKHPAARPKKIALKAS